MLGAALQSVHIKARPPERLAARTAAPRRLYRPGVDIRRRGQRPQKFCLQYSNPAAAIGLHLDNSRQITSHPVSAVSSSRSAGLPIAGLGRLETVRFCTKSCEKPPFGGSLACYDRKSIRPRAPPPDHSQQSLPPTDIMPGIEFSSDLAVDAHRFEAHGFVQPDARVIWQRDARKCSVIAQSRRGR